MKEPFLALAGTTALVASTGVVHDPALADRIGAVLAAGVVSSLYSWWKSRKRKAEPVDAGIWALITLFGSMSLGWFAAPAVADRILLGIDLPGIPLMTWLLTIGGSPIIEFLLDGHAWRAVLRRIDQRPANPEK